MGEEESCEYLRANFHLKNANKLLLHTDLRLIRPPSIKLSHIQSTNFSSINHSVIIKEN